MKRLLLILIALGAITANAFGQAGYSSPDTGNKVLGTYFSADVDTIDMQNGNLHVHIPLFSLPGRELPVSVALDYNAFFIEDRVFQNEYGNYVHINEFMGWRKN